jgi:hypothetical protein
LSTRHLAIAAAGIALAVAAWAAWPARRASGPEASAEGPAPDEAGGAALSCEHPFVPSTPGVTYEYRSESSSGVGTLRVRVLGVRRAGDELEVTWVTEGEPEARMVRRCGEAGAEEPWLAFGSGEGGLEIRDQTWRVPRSLAIGDEYAGSYTAAVSIPGAEGLGVTMQRTHRVVGRETLSAAGRTFDALRVEVEDRSELASEPVAMTEWIAEEVGLVRLWMGPEEYRTELTLVAIE